MENIETIRRSLFKSLASIYASVKDTKPTRNASLMALLTGDTYRDQVKAVRAEKDPAEQERKKRALPAFTPSGVFEGAHRAENLKEHSGFIIIDIDAADNPDLVESGDFKRFKDAAAGCPNIAYCGRSVRGKGYFCLIPIADPARHRQYFRNLQMYFERCGVVIDPSGADVCRLRYVSYDADPYINTAAKIFRDDSETEEKEPDQRDFDLKPGDTEKLECLLRMAEQNKCKAFDSYNDWARMLMAIANTYGDSTEGRGFACRLSALSDKYDMGETEAKYDGFLKKRFTYKSTLGTVFYCLNEATKGTPDEDFKDL